MLNWQMFMKKRKQPRTNSAPRSPGPSTFTEESTVDLGTIVILDIVDFSIHDMGKQKAMVRKLWACLRKWRQLKGKSLLNCTGDGALFVLNPDSVNMMQLVTDAHEIIQQMSTDSGNARADLRIGMHVGSFCCLKLDKSLPLQAIGTGPNECQRVCSVGGAGDIVVSNQFFNRCEAQFKDISARFWPIGSAPPHEITVKHNELAEVRFFQSDVKKPKIAPERIRTAEVLNNQARSVCKEIWDKFSEFAVERTEQDPKVRVSLFAPRSRRLGEVASPNLIDKPGVLRLTNIRIENAKFTEGSNGTPYTDTDWPVGLAFSSRKTQTENNLANFVDEEEKYIQQLGSKGVESGRVRDFGKKPRCLIATPIIFEGTAEPLAVLCLDAGVPLNLASPADLNTFADESIVSQRAQLAMIWRLGVR